MSSWTIYKSFLEISVSQSLRQKDSVLSDALRGCPVLQHSGHFDPDLSPSRVNKVCVHTYTYSCNQVNSWYSRTHCNMQCNSPSQCRVYAWWYVSTSVSWWYLLLGIHNLLHAPIVYLFIIGAYIPGSHPEYSRAHWSSVKWVYSYRTYPTEGLLHDKNH